MGLKILTTRQMLQRLPISLAQVKVGKKSEILLNQIKKMLTNQILLTNQKKLRKRHTRT